MKIYFLFYAYEIGIFADIGGFRKLWELADRLQKRGHKVRIFFPKLPKHYPLKPVPYTSYPLFNCFLLRPISAYISMFFCVLVRCFKERPDIIYFRASLNIFPVVFAKYLGAKIVMEVNANFREFHKTIAVSPFRHFLFLVSEKFNVIFSDKFIALTPGLKEMLIKQHKISPDKIAVVPSGTDTGHFSPQESKEAKRKIGIKPNFPVIGFAGIFYPHQGLNTLILAAHSILNSYPNTLFLIVGKGIMEKSWKDLVKSEGVENAFLFTGQVPYEKMPVYFNSMEIFVTPFASNRGETSPLKVFDALACGKVVVSSDIPSIHLLAQELNGSIVLVPPDNTAKLGRTIVELLSDEVKRNKLVKNAREIILKKYSWEAIADQVASILKALS